MANLNETTVKTFEDSGLSNGEAKVQTLRLQGLSHSEIADQLDIKTGTVASYCNRIDNNKTVRLPGISKIETTTRVSPEEYPAVVIWFDNGAKLRYVNQNGTVLKEVFKADDPDSVYESYDISVDPESMQEAALESIAEYINIYRDNLYATRADWPHVYESLLLIPA